MWCKLLQFSDASAVLFKSLGLISLFLMFLRQDSYAHQGWFYLIKNAVNTEEFP